ncbi:hypothetical protein BKA65DRAFT_540973 [Rhexocercosporidium sp. MPI-PUGE-AT-0058]|nr:hypothetical protein BKA65DRAFT_540973 [Rhexocercosporidium sp. MPI-PUGE-AT-0058]
MFKPIYVIFVLLASIAFLWLSYIGPPPPVVHQNIYLPYLESKPTFLLGNLSYRAFDKSAEQLWDDLVPANNGAVIATNITSGFHLWAIPAMFHQLRCLRDIRTYFIATSLSWNEAQKFMSERGPGSPYDNVAYCFNYVRQSILCHADTTLHPVARLTADVNIVDGNALWHMCRDPSVLYRWAEKSGKPRKVDIPRKILWNIRKLIYFTRTNYSVSIQ